MRTDLPIVKDRLTALTGTLTPSEQVLADILLKDYPVAGLQSITRLAEAAGVSTPTVIRMARKLGFEGFPAMQEALRVEASEQIRRPATKRDAWLAGAPDEHILAQFAEAVTDNLRHTLDRLDSASFDAVAALLADPKRPLYIVGGRITRSNADYLFNHMQIIRPGVTHLSHSANVWPQYLLDIDDRAILIVFDIRRYESDLMKLATLAQEREATIVLFTDQWGSPIGKTAAHTFHAMVEAPSSWDSTLAIMLIVEALIARAQAGREEASRDRLEELESMFSTTRLFRDFS
ncbi:MAG: MurR/RpiR family transcriptional regulator [Pseudomonadota bacterium]